MPRADTDSLFHFLNGREAEIHDFTLLLYNSPEQEEHHMAVSEQSTEVQYSCILFYYKSTITHKWHKEHETWILEALKHFIQK